MKIKSRDTNEKIVIQVDAGPLPPTRSAVHGRCLPVLQGTVLEQSDHCRSNLYDYHGDAMKLCSTRHPKRQIGLVDELPFWRFMDLECTSKKLSAIDIDPAFLSSDVIDFDYEAELNELMIDYKTMFPENADGI